MTRGDIQERVKALKDEDEDVREAAVKALGEIGSDAEEAVPALIEAVDDDYLAWEAVNALGRIGGESALRALSEALLSDEDMGVRMRAAMALRRIGDRDAVPALIKALADEDEYVRVSAAAALGEIGDQTASPALEVALGDVSDIVRQAATRALKSINA